MTAPFGIKTDNAALIGVHCFQAAGLGQAPFSWVGYTDYGLGASFDSNCHCCDYCSKPLRHVCEIMSADGDRFFVGTDCLKKTGDRGLLKAYKYSPQVRAQKRAAIATKDAKTKEEWQVIMTDPAKVAALSVPQVWKYNGDGQEPWIDFARRAWGYCGVSGRARYLRQAKKFLSTSQIQ